jgi:hypothetical protein
MLACVLAISWNRWWIRAERGRAGGETVPLDDLDRLDRGGAGDRVAAEGGAERSGPERVEEVGAPGDGSDGIARPERLRGHEQVGRHARVLDREHAAGARHARLDLVSDEQDVVTLADRGDALQEARRRHDEPALALDGLDDDRGDVLGREVRLERLFEEPHVQLRERFLIAPRHERPVRIRIRQVRDARHGGAHERQARVLRLPGRGHRRIGAAVERVLERHDPFAPRRDARDLHRVLDGLGAAVREDALRRDGVPLGLRIDAVELLREAHVRLVGHRLRAHVRVLLELLLHGRDDVGMLVPEVERADAGDEVEVALPLGVEDLRSGGASDHHWRAGMQPLGDVPLAERADLLARDARFLRQDSHPATPIRSSMSARSS